MVRAACYVDDVSRPFSKQVEILRAMTPSQRVAAAERLYWSARELKSAYLRAKHPGWTSERLATEVKEAFLNARS